jgi:hypothetical protein
MNCKQGDLARIVRPSPRVKEPMLDRLCVVLRAAHSGDNEMPDGYLVENTNDTPSWVIELSSDIHAMTSRRRWRKTRFGVIDDASLRPIRDPGDDATDETLLWQPVPSRELETLS